MKFGSGQSKSARLRSHANGFGQSIPGQMMFCAWVRLFSGYPFLAALKGNPNTISGVPKKERASRIGFGKASV